MNTRQIRPLAYVAAGAVGFFSGLSKKIVPKIANSQTEQRNHSIAEVYASGGAAACVALGSVNRAPFAGNPTVAARTARGSLAGLAFSLGVMAGESAGEAVAERVSFNPR